MKVGFFFSAKKSNGGAYQYALSLLKATQKKSENTYVIFKASEDFPEEYGSHLNCEIVNFCDKKERRTFWPVTNISPYALRLGFSLDRIIHDSLLLARAFPLLNLFYKTFRVKDIIREICSHETELLIFSSPHHLAFLTPIPSVVPIYDLQHRLNRDFPEVSKGRTFLNKEYLYSQIAKKSYRILADSKEGKEDIVRCYKVRSTKIKILPYLPPPYITKHVSKNDKARIKKKYHLPDNFLFYPASFWPHKNHINLFKAMHILVSNNTPISLVLSGSRQENFKQYYDELINLVKFLRLDKSIHFLGFVNNEDMSAIYSNAVALVMPTFFGPTNIPVLEAWKVGCPVLYSNIRGCREQAGGAALLINPADPTDIADRIKFILSNPHIRDTLIRKGRERLARWTEDDVVKKINNIINDFKNTHA